MPQGFKFMVSCDSCSKWYHGDFVTIPQEIRENENKEVVWQCPRCQPVCNLHNVMHLCVNPGSDSSPEDSIFAAERCASVRLRRLGMRLKEHKEACFMDKSAIAERIWMEDRYCLTPHCYITAFLHTRLFLFVC